MEKKPSIPHQPEHPHPEQQPETPLPPDPEDPLHVPEEAPDFELEEDPYETPPAYDLPEPGEGP